MQLWICCVFYYGEYIPDTEPRVFADTEAEAIEKGLAWCRGMNQKAIEIRAYPYVKGF